MVALLRPHPRQPRLEEGGPSVPALRLVVDNTLPADTLPADTLPVGTLPVGGGRPSRWSLPVFDGGPSLAAVAAVALVVFGVLGAIRLAQGPIGPTGSASVQAPSSSSSSVEVDPARPAPGDGVVVAEPGDTLWSIAVELAPGEDPRPVVSALIEANGGPSLAIGQQIVIPKQLLD